MEMGDGQREGDYLEAQVTGKVPKQLEKL